MNNNNNNNSQSIKKLGMTTLILNICSILESSFKDEKEIENLKQFFISLIANDVKNIVSEHYDLKPKYELMICELKEKLRHREDHIENLEETIHLIQSSYKQQIKKLTENHPHLFYSIINDSNQIDIPKNSDGNNNINNNNIDNINIINNNINNNSSSNNLTSNGELSSSSHENIFDLRKLQEVVEKKKLKNNSFNFFTAFNNNNKKNAKN
jgi:hypothetical protein